MQAHGNQSQCKARKSNDVYEKDQFFTNPAIARECVAMLNLNEYDLCIEPSAGRGGFYNCLPTDKRVGVELDRTLCDATEGLRCMSWLDYSTSMGNTLVIGNPPFGTQNSLAIRFFNHAARFARTIAFIIPCSWKREHVQNKLSMQFKLQSSVDLPVHTENHGRLFQGTLKTEVRCCFQIWDRSKTGPREPIVPTLTHADWTFLKCNPQHESSAPQSPVLADFIIQAYGHTPGVVEDNLSRWVPKNVHFIKSKIGVDELKRRFRGLDFSKANHSARQLSMGKGMLVQLYQKRFGNGEGRVRPKALSKSGLRLKKMIRKMHRQYRATPNIVS
jgi:hypothetical protein